MKILILFIITILSIPLVVALDICEDAPEISTNCAMITPKITYCDNYNYTIFNVNGTTADSGNLTALESDVYYFNLTIKEGKYIIRLCDGAIREIKVKEDENKTYYLYAVALLIFIGLLGLGYYLEDTVPIILSGMLSILIAINLFVNGFPNLTNDFLKHGIIIVLAGIGFYFILAPSIEDIKSWGGRLLKVE